jgi:hypothetical protein
MIVQLTFQSGLFYQINSDRPETIAMWLEEYIPVIAALPHYDEVRLRIFPTGDFDYRNFQRDDVLTEDKAQQILDLFKNWAKEDS